LSNRRPELEGCAWILKILVIARGAHDKVRAMLELGAIALIILVARWVFSLWDNGTAPPPRRRVKRRSLGGLDCDDY